MKLLSAIAQIIRGIFLAGGYEPCRHENVRCVHGDEIVIVGGRRRVCLDCGRSLKGQMPEICFFSGKPHAV